MTRMERARATGLCLSSLLWAAAAGSQPLSVERAVQIALEKNTQMVNARASVLEAKGGLYGAWAGVLPEITASWSRSLDRTKNSSGSQLFGTSGFVILPNDQDTYSTGTTLSGTLGILDPSALRSVSSARAGFKASNLSLKAARADVAFATRRQYYEVVKAYHLVGVANASAKLARDDGRRVRALFEVGSVSRSDLLRAQVRTATSQLDSLTAYQNVVSQRILLAQALAVAETEMGEVDTLLTAEPHEYDEAELLADAGKKRPDLQAADAELSSARAAASAAGFSRLPYVTLSGSVQLNPERTTTQTILTTNQKGGSNSRADQALHGTLAVNWDILNELRNSSRTSTAKARVLRAEESRDALRRNLEAEVHQALLTYREALERELVANRSYESATENLKLTQQKYNVGSTTILDLIDAQVSLTRAAADRVTALATIRVAEAQLSRVRGQAE